MTPVNRADRILVALAVVIAGAAGAVALAAHSGSRPAHPPAVHAPPAPIRPSRVVL